MSVSENPRSNYNGAYVFRYARNACVGFHLVWYAKNVQNFYAVLGRKKIENRSSRKSQRNSTLIEIFYQLQCKLAANRQRYFQNFAKKTVEKPFGRQIKSRRGILCAVRLNRVHIDRMNNKLLLFAVRQYNQTFPLDVSVLERLCAFSPSVALTVTIIVQGKRRRIIRLNNEKTPLCALTTI